MRHPLFGNLRYDRAERAWSGALVLPRFMAVRRQIETASNSIVDKAVGHPTDFSEIERQPVIGPSDADTGFHVWIEAPAGVEPSPAQEAAGRLLMEREDEIFRSVMAALFDAYRLYFEDEQARFAAVLAGEPDQQSRDWRRSLQQRYGLPAISSVDGLGLMCHLPDLRLPQTRIGGVAPLVFPVKCDWEQEHGPHVVYHPLLGAEFTFVDGLEDYAQFDDSSMGRD